MLIAQFELLEGIASGVLHAQIQSSIAALGSLLLLSYAANVAFAVGKE